MNKKLIAIILGVLAITGLLIWFFVSKKQPSQISPPGATGQVGNVAMVNLPEKAFYPSFSLDQKNILYLPGQDFSLKEFNLGAQKTQAVSPPYFGFVENIVWSPQKDKVIVWVENNREGLQTIQSPFLAKDKEDNLVLPHLFDLKTKVTTPLSPQIQTAVFVENGQKVVYQFRDDKTNTLNLANPDGKNWQKILDLKEEKIYLAVLGTEEIVYTPEGSTDTFSVIRLDGAGQRTVKLPVSVNPRKTVWSSDGKLVVVALREGSEQNDSFYKVNIETSEKEKIDYRVAQPTDPIDAQNLLLAADGKTLYFTSNNILYQLILK